MKSNTIVKAAIALGLLTAAFPLVSSAQIISTFTIMPAATSTCPVIGSYMKMGWKNDPKDVSKLQTFLGAPVTGNFDQATEQAVESFQRKNLSEVLGPWGATKPSGVVYITTAKVMNKIACGAPLTLDSKEIAAIMAYNKAAGAGQAQVASEPAIQASIAVSNSSAAEESSTSMVTVEPSMMDQTAAAANPSILGRFWGFIVGLFR